MSELYLYIFSFVGTLFPTFLGSIFPFLFKKVNKNTTSFFMTFAIGMITSLLFIELIPHSFEHSASIFSKEIYGYLLSLGVILLTCLLFFFLHELMHKFTHHHSHDEKDITACLDHVHSNEIISKEKVTFLSSLIYLFAIFIHNIPEGFVLGTFFEEDAIPINGIIMSISLFIHNIVIGYSISLSFKNSNKSKLFSILLTSLNGLVSFILAIIGYYFSISFPEIVSVIIFSISGGSLLYVLFIELLPQLFYEYKSKYSFLLFAFGFIIATFLILI